MKRHKMQPIKLYGQASVGTKGLKLVSGFMTAGPRHDDATLLVPRLKMLLYHLSGSFGHVSDIDAGTHLKQPDGHSSPQSGRNVFGDNNDKAHWSFLAFIATVFRTNDVLHPLWIPGWESQAEWIPAALQVERSRRRPEPPQWWG